MRKRLFAILVACVLTFSLVGCGRTTTLNINVESNIELNNTTLGIDSLISIGSGLYYDSTTRIVYWWNGTMSTFYNFCTTPTAYYAPMKRLQYGNKRIILYKNAL